MHNLMAVGFLLAMLGQAQAQPSAPAPTPEPTAADLYVGCSLFLHHTDVLDQSGSFSATECSLVALGAIANREGHIASKFRFCLPKDAAMRADPARQMAGAYVDYFEKQAPKIATQEGRAFFIFAMMGRWPCQG